MELTPSQIKFLKHRFIFLASNFILFFFWLSFAWRHLKAFLDYPQFYLIIFIFSETLVAILFLCRQPEKDISPYGFDWLIAISGTFLPLFFQPGKINFSLTLSITLMSAGIMLQILSLFSLGRSLGIVPANRGIKTRGMYALVRHPMYTSYFLTYTGYIIVSFSVLNFALYVFTLATVFFRITLEEEHLKKDEKYKKYQKKVPWRLAPHIY